MFVNSIRRFNSNGPTFLLEKFFFLLRRTLHTKCICMKNRNKEIQGLTPGEVQDSKICDTRGGVIDFTILHLLRCLTLFLTPFYRVNICLLVVQFGALIYEPHHTHRTKMPHNKIKQDFHFTTLKRFKIIKLTVKLVIDCTITKSCTFYDVCLIFSSHSIFAYVEKIQSTLPCQVTNVNKNNYLSLTNVK